MNFDSKASADRRMTISAKNKHSYCQACHLPTPKNRAPRPPPNRFIPIHIRHQGKNVAEPLSSPAPLLHPFSPSCLVLPIMFFVFCRTMGAKTPPLRSMSSMNVIDRDGGSLIRPPERQSDRASGSKKEGTEPETFRVCGGQGLSLPSFQPHRPSFLSQLPRRNRLHISSIHCRRHRRRHRTVGRPTRCVSVTLITRR